MNIHRFLLVIPSIDIKDGKTVRVVQGIPELNCAEYGNDPVEMAKLWRAENSKMIHIVDFDGAIDHSHKNLKIIEKICSSVVIPVEFSGGIRNLDDAKVVMDSGVSRMAINTMAIENKKEFDRLFQLYGPTKVVICLDIIDEELVTRGRRKKTGINYIGFAKEMAEIGIDRFIVTDVNRNGLLQGPNIQYSLNIAKNSNCKVTHSGGIRNKDELMDLQSLINEGIDSVIVGRAFYENRFPCQKLWRVAESGIFN
ncbi:MAG: 1-(5-phosphoribosyl)-5-[(5-phosphoribosylamino)methylideneamino] imidazole-4-carboxamide isomerase [Ignavibacteriaceae bacterium]|nr:1-(5-phosphoribosyl)-5-[(5-phosphoribosylamino)methylideneamino] imidazole-4-carboxamide isomerase [Ignavibacteriaceae bacterium]